MRKVILKAAALALIVSLLACAFAGCGKKDATKDEEGRTIVSVGNWPAKSNPQYESMNERKTRFEKANPDVSIRPDEWTWDRKTFYAKAAGGQLPIVYQTGFTEMPEIISSEYSADISEVLSKHGFDGMLNEDILEVISKDGKVYALPNSTYVLGLAFNTELMKSAGLMEADGTPKQPKDWNEVADFAVKIKKATGKPGIVFPSSGNYGGWMFMPVAWSFGVDFMEKDKDGKWQATFDTKEAVKALQYIKDLKWKYDVLPSTTLIDGTEYNKTFATGNAGMMIAAGDVPTKVFQYGMKPDHIGMMAMPAGPKRHVTLLGGGVYCINANATEDQIDAALRWLETAISFETTEEFKTNTKNYLDQCVETNQLVGVKGMSMWSDKAESQAWSNKLVDDMANSNINHVRLYNEFVADCPADIQPEEPVCAQELYAVIDSLIQEVLTNKDADCAKLLKKANADFQSNYLDNLTY
ncbi:MAG: extracellular solute-binding protein [Clostridia bacterium]|nr:extracellular solute-binding protein [Clostridia bacterium]